MLLLDGPKHCVGDNNIQAEKQAVSRRRDEPTTCRMLIFLCVALASGMYVAAMLFTSTTAAVAQRATTNFAASLPPDAPAAVEDAAAIIPDRGDGLAPLEKVATPGGPHMTIVTGGQVPVHPVLAAGSQANERSTHYNKSTSDPRGNISRVADKIATGINLQHEQREKDAGSSTSTNLTAVAVDEQEELEEPLGCIPCDAMFRKVEETQFGTKVQNVTVQVRAAVGTGCLCVRVIFTAACMCLRCFHHLRLGSCLLHPVLPFVVLAPRSWGLPCRLLSCPCCFRGNRIVT